MSDSTPRPAPALPPLVLDTRPIFARGETPCRDIDDAMARLAPNQNFILLLPYEPVPLYARLAWDGFTHKSKQLEDGTWRVEFQKPHGSSRGED